jgi:hypothetical protein
MGSRVRLATVTCLVASGLLVGGAGGAFAFADPDAKNGESHSQGDEEPQRDAEMDSDDLDRGDDGRPDGEGDDPGRGAGEGPGIGDGDRNGDGVGDQPPGTVTRSPTAEPTKTEPTKTEPTQTEPTKTPTPTETPTEEPTQPGACEDKDDECGAGSWWPWWPWPWPSPRPPGVGPQTGGGGGSGGGFEPPVFNPPVPPAMEFPRELPPAEPVNVVPGAEVPVAGAPVAPITVPVIVAPSAGLGGGSAAATAPLPRAPRVVEAEPPAVRQAPPAGSLSNASGPAPSYRAGYSDYLRTAGMSQLVALAAPGLTGILVLTGAGGLLGYRQAKAGHAVRPGVARFVN